MGKVRIFGVNFDDVTAEEAVRRVLLDEEPQSVVTPNALMLEACFKNPEYRRLLNSASMVLPDGAGVTAAAKRQGTPLKSRVAGIDFAEMLLAASAKLGKRVFFLGGADGIAPAAAEAMKLRFPGLKVAGCYWGFFNRYGEENYRLREWITSSRAEILLVCLGFPLQEYWIMENLPFLPTVCAAVGLGGTLDVWAGQKNRAPESVRQHSLEWAWRMISEPSRLRGLPSMIRFADRIRQLHPELSQSNQNSPKNDLYS